MGKALTWRTLACTLLPMLAAAGGGGRPGAELWLRL